MRSLLLCLLCSCANAAQAPLSSALDACLSVESGVGSPGAVPLRVEVIASQLEVPWSLAFLPGGDALLTERPGRLRLLRSASTRSEPGRLPLVADIAVDASSEGGLLGLALHPRFAENRLFYLYLTVREEGRKKNRVERWRLAADAGSASFDKRVVDDIPSAEYHDGGRLRFGPDGMLYVGTGDGREPDRAQDLSSLGGKLLRVTPDGEVPADNPFPGSPVFALGVRNTQGFAWLDARHLYLVDHGPTGELLRFGHDEVNFLTAGANLGWPMMYGCESLPGMVSPSLTWKTAVPPGGAALYRGAAIPEWRGSLLIGTLGSRHLHRVKFSEQDPSRVALHETYLEGDAPRGHGRLRDVVEGPDGAVYVTTSNCDRRGHCPPGRDEVLRITRAK